MKRIVAFSYGTLCYLVCLATFLYAVAFIGNIGLTRTINGEATVLPCCHESISSVWPLKS